MKRDVSSSLLHNPSNFNEAQAKSKFDPPPLGFEPQIFEQKLSRPRFEFWGRLDQYSDISIKNIDILLNRQYILS